MIRLLVLITSLAAVVLAQEIVRTPDDGLVTANEAGATLKCSYNVSDSETGKLLEVTWYSLKDDMVLQHLTVRTDS